jgi:hypothetical protein
MNRSATASPPLQINVPLLRKTLEFAEAHPKEIDLGSWAKWTSCGTTACIAGTVCHLAGHQIDWKSADCVGEVDQLTDGRNIEAVAMKELRIGNLGANLLFYCEDLDGAWAIAEELTDGEIQRPVK